MCELITGLFTTGATTAAATTAATAGTAATAATAAGAEAATFLGISGSAWAGIGASAAAAMSLGTGIMSGVQAQKAANEQARIEQQQAQAERIRAEQEMDAAKRETIDAARRARQEKGTGIAQMAANGVMIDDAREGSEATIYEGDSAAELAYDQAKIIHNAQLRAWGYDNNATVMSAEARQTQLAGRNKARAGYVAAPFQALSSGLSTYSGIKSLLS